MSLPGEDPELALGASLDLAWADLEEGEPEDALARVAGLSEEHGEAALIEKRNPAPPRNVP